MFKHIVPHLYRSKMNQSFNLFPLYNLIQITCFKPVTNTFMFYEKGKFKSQKAN